MSSIGPVDRQRMLLATFLITAFTACVMVLFFRVIPPDNKDLMTYMIGQLSGMATMALGFYFTNKAGQDAADAEKAANTGKMADAIVATAQAASNASSPSTAAEEAARATAQAAQDRAEKYEPLRFNPDEEVKRESDI